MRGGHQGGSVGDDVTADGVAVDFAGGRGCSFTGEQGICGQAALDAEVVRVQVGAQRGQLHGHYSGAPEGSAGPSLRREAEPGSEPASLAGAGERIEMSGWGVGDSSVLKIWSSMR